jgi:hypothetical protein
MAWCQKLQTLMQRCGLKCGRGGVAAGVCVVAAAKLRPVIDLCGVCADTLGWTTNHNEWCSWYTPL